MVADYHSWGRMPTHGVRLLSGVYAVTWMLELRSQRRNREIGRRPTLLLQEV